jgi:thioredoxin 1
MLQCIAKGALLLSILVFGAIHLAGSDAKIIFRQDAGMSINDYNIKTSNKEKLVFVYFHADWCVPCIKLKTVMEEIEKEEKSKMIMMKLDVDENPQIATFFEINTLPQFMLYKKGKAVWTHSGLLSKQDLMYQIDSWADKKN